ncbi:MAG: hypothetical protein ACRD0P_39855, partial [Stackebrandtia sp.]
NYGVQHRDGSVTMWSPSGYLVGSYRSIDSALHRLSRGTKRAKWLVWLEPQPPTKGPATSAAGHAQQEFKYNSPQSWTMTVGFTAHGPHGARVVAMDLAQALFDTLPGFRREAVTLWREDNPELVSVVFCDRDQSCLLPPDHFPPCRGEEDVVLDEAGGRS